MTIRCLVKIGSMYLTFLIHFAIVQPISMSATHEINLKENYIVKVKAQIALGGVSL